MTHKRWPIIKQGIHCWMLQMVVDLHKSCNGFNKMNSPVGWYRLVLTYTSHVMVQQNEQSCWMVQMGVDLNKSCNGYEHKQLNIPLTNGRAIIKKFQTSGTVANLPGRGRKCILSPRTVRKAKKNPTTTVRELKALVASWGHKVSKSTIRSPPYQQALWKGCMKKALTESNKQIQASGVCQTPLELWLEQGQMRPKLNFLAMYTVGMFDVKRGMHTRKNTYCQIWWWIIDALGLFCCLLSRSMVQWIPTSTRTKTWVPLPGSSDLAIGGPYNKKKSKSTQKWFCENKINVLQWLSQSPNLNPIENMWSDFELKTVVHKHKSKDMKDLEWFCMEDWSKIPPNLFSNLIKHSRNRLSAIILARGGCTKH